jgi:hypothetical protein
MSKISLHQSLGVVTCDDDASDVACPGMYVGYNVALCHGISTRYTTQAGGVSEQDVQKFVLECGCEMRHIFRRRRRRRRRGGGREMISLEEEQG